MMGALITDFCLGVFSSSRKGSWSMFGARSTSTACTSTNYSRLLKHLECVSFGVSDVELGQPCVELLKDRIVVHL